MKALTPIKQVIEPQMVEVGQKVMVDFGSYKRAGTVTGTTDGLMSILVSISVDSKGQIESPPMQAAVGPGG